MFRIYNLYLEKYHFILNHHPMHGFCIDIYTLPFIPYHLYLTIWECTADILVTGLVFRTVALFFTLCSVHTNSAWVYAIFSKKSDALYVNETFFERRKSMWFQAVYCIPKTPSRKSSENKANHLVLTLCFHLRIYLYIFQLYFYIQSSIPESYYNWIIKCCYIYAS